MLVYNTPYAYVIHIYVYIYIYTDNITHNRRSASVFKLDWISRPQNDQAFDCSITLENV